MRYSKPHYYDEFRCLAGNCPDTCCAGWQICIDDASLEKYENTEGPFGSRLANSIDWEEGAFYQYERRCVFLNEENFCDLQIELGEDALCDTCRMYPRHVEEFDGLRELSLSLSCPEAARMMLTCREPVRFETWETEEEEDSFEDDEMDYLLFTRLEDAREVMFDILKDRSFGIEERMEMVLELAKDMQRCIDEDRSFDMDDVIRQFRNSCREKSGDSPAGRGNAGSMGCGEDFSGRYERCCREFAVFGKMELLRREWGKIIDNMWDSLYAPGEDNYVNICRKFDAFCGSGGRYMLRQQVGEQLMMFFVYTYFCGAVYDGEIAVKIRFAVFSTRWILELSMYRYLEKGGNLSMDDVIKMAWRYAREVEHSDVNLEIMEEWLG